MTSAEIEVQHLDALASLSNSQRDAIHRNREALRVCNFSHHAFRDVLADLFARDALAAGPEMVTADEVKRQHLGALASLTKAQRVALHRVERCYQQSHFSLHSFREILMEMFEAEAAETKP